MKLNKIFIILTTVLSFAAISCQKSELKEPYPRNVGEEYLNVSDSNIDFLGRGGSVSFTVDASYDGTMVAPDWVSLTAGVFPGDTRKFTVAATVLSNKTGQDRKGEIVISTPNLSKTIQVNQPAYNRPEIPNPIKSADDFVEFITNAPYVEEGEIITIEGSINLDGKTITTAEYFNGVLDGQGNTISNLNASGPLFATLNGSIHGLSFTSSCKFTLTAGGAEIYFGPFAGHNHGTVENCGNDGVITINGNATEKQYIGGIVAYGYENSITKNCTNKGRINYVPESSVANAYIGGIVAYNYGDASNNHNYGAIVCEPGAYSAQYHIGGITSRQEHGALAGNINHKDADITVNDKYSSTSKSYVGGIVGRIEGTPLPATNNSEMYADIYFAPKVESYVGALQGWQAAVNIGASPLTTLFESSVVNCNISAYTKGKGQYGNNPCLSAGFVTGRFSGQSGKETLHYGTLEKPIRVSGSITSLQTGEKVTATSGDFVALLDGDGSKTSVNGGGIPEADYNTIRYEVVGDGQTGPAEELIVTTDNVKVEVPMVGGKASFIFKANYDATLQTANDWLSFSETEAEVEKVIPASGAEQTVDIYAAENTKTTDREGKVSIKLPMGSYKEVTVFQPGNKTLPAELSVDGKELEALPEGSDVTFKVTANYDATVTTECSWLTIKQATVKGDYSAQTVTVTAASNDASDAADRTGTVKVTVKDKVETVTISQKKFTFTPKEDIASAKDFADFMKYGGNADLYPAGFNVKLSADIDLKGVAVGTIPTLVANFDGQGHSLKNWACEGPLFGQINGGVVKGIVIDSSCKIALKYENSILNGSNRCLGVICGDLLSGSIENCTNNAAVSVATFGDAYTFVGIMAGRTSPSQWVKNCVNNGAVTIKPTATVTDFRFGAIVGGSNGNIINSKNNAPIDVAPADVNAGIFRVGGIAGYLGKNADQTLAGCVNTQKGKITFNPAKVTSIKQSYIGGVLGYLDGQMKANTDLSGDKNFGDVCSMVNNELVAVGGLFGWSNGGGTPNDLFPDGVVNCNVTAGFASTDGSAVNPCQSAGLVVGRVAVKSGKDNVTAQCGTVDHPIKVAGSVTLAGGKTVTASADNFLNLYKGSAFVDADGKFHFNGVYEAVTKE